MRKMYLGQVRRYVNEICSVFSRDVKEKLLNHLEMSSFSVDRMYIPPNNRTPYLQLYTTGGLFELPEPYELPESFKRVLKAAILSLKQTTAVLSHCSK